MNFRRLEVYQHAIRLLPLATRLAGSLPAGNGGLADQLRRASISVPSNIAEGSGKTSGADQRRFFAIARGSAMECGAILDSCRALEFVDDPTYEAADALLTPIVRMLSKMCPT